MESAHIFIKRINNSEFIINLNRKIPELSQKIVSDVFYLDIENYTFKEDYSYNYSLVNSQQILLKIKPEKEILNTKLNIKTNFTDYDLMYDDQKNFIYSLEGTIEID